MRRIISIIITFFFLTVNNFAQSTEYSKYISKAKEYENNKQWAFALDAYYDALGCSDEPSLKIDALNGYITLSEAIKSGYPGLGKYNPFVMHDEWKKLLIDAEKLGSTICKFELHLGKLEQADLNYETRTASYKSKVQIEVSDRYKKTIAVIEEGYNVAYKSDWIDLPKAENWPFYSVSSAKNAVYNVAGAKIFEVPSRQKNMPSEYYNAFSVFSWGYNVFYSYRRSNNFNRTLYDYKFNIVDENGKELVKGNRWLLSFKTRFAGLQHTPQGDIELLENEPSEIIIDGITPSVMDLIDNGKAFINPVAVYLEYGKYNRDDDKVKVDFNHNDGRTFIKNLPEIQLDISKAMIYCWNKTEDINAISFNKTLNKNITVPLIKSYFDKISVNSKIIGDYKVLLFEIPLDEAYTNDYNMGKIFKLKDNSGKLWIIDKEVFLTTLNEITEQDYSINDNKPYSLKRAATDTEKTTYENTLIDVVKLYFEKISAKGIIIEDYKILKFEIPLDEAYTDDYNMGEIFELKDASGKLCKIKKEIFLETLNKTTKLDYSMIKHGDEYYLQRDVTDTEKNAYNDLREISLNDAVKLYFEKISTKGRIYEYMGYNLFEIPLDKSYHDDYYSYFTLKDSSGKEWKISQDEFLAILKKILNQEYRINYNRLSRTPTEEEEAAYKSAKQKY